MKVAQAKISTELIAEIKRAQNSLQITEDKKKSQKKKKISFQYASDEVAKYLNKKRLDKLKENG